MILHILDSDTLHKSYRTLRETILKYWVLISPLCALSLPSVQCDCNSKWLQKHQRKLETTHVQCAGYCAGLASQILTSKSKHKTLLICSWHPNHLISSQTSLLSLLLFYTVNCIIPVDSINGFFSHVSEENQLPIPRVILLIGVGIKMITKSK